MFIIKLYIIVSFTVFSSVSNVEGRGPFIRSHKMTLGELEKLAKKEKNAEYKLAEHKLFMTQKPFHRSDKLAHHHDDHRHHHDDHRHRHHHDHREPHDDHREPYTPSPLDVDKYGTTSYSQMTNPLPKWGVYLNPVGSDVYDNSMWHNIVNSHKDN